MTREQLELYVARLDEFSSWASGRQIDFIAYFLSTQPNKDSFTAREIDGCFELLSLHRYTRLAQYLSENTGKPRSKYIKHTRGYRLERRAFDAIRVAVDAEPQRIQVSQHLVDLIPKVNDSQERSFLEEAIRCYRVEAFRAAIVMVWALTVDHLQKYVFGQHLTAFNTAIAAHSDKRMKPVVQYDDFSELKEKRIVELLRGANIISGDVKRILDEKLGVRNSAGHPSGITFSGHKTTEFCLDLIQNVILKY
ncbi:MAG: hypothetical protein KGL11_15040 [Alphaproteobacteria bacterium]|nr:hypothetical protein [Alphaproteobacteria bacterium]